MIQYQQDMDPSFLDFQRELLCCKPLKIQRILDSNESCSGRSPKVISTKLLKTPMGVFFKKLVTFSLYLAIIEYSSVWCVVVNNRSPMDLKLGGRP